MPPTPPTSPPGNQIPCLFTHLGEPKPIGEHDWPERTVPLLSIVCFTYKQEKFIAECMDGFLIQETTFPVEIIIHDDASPDRTAEIVRAYHDKYPRLIRPIFQTENQYRQGKDFTRDVYIGAKGDYIAICEGDDYWTDPAKLQAQVDYLEKHSESALCCHRVKAMDTECQKELFQYPGLVYRTGTYSTEQLLQDDFVPTCSVVFRRAFVPVIPAEFRRLKMGDWQSWVFISLNGTIAFMETAMAHYRVHGGGMWSSLSSLEQLNAIRDLFQVFLRHLDRRLRPTCQRKLADVYYRIAETYSGISDRRAANTYAFRALRLMRFGDLRKAAAVLKLLFKTNFPRLFHHLRRGYKGIFARGE